jgi:hypothetical protein
VVIPHFNAHEVVRATFAHHLQGHFSQGQGGYPSERPQKRKNRDCRCQYAVRRHRGRRNNSGASYPHVIRMPVHIALNVRPVCRTHTFSDQEPEIRTCGSHHEAADRISGACAHVRTYGFRRRKHRATLRFEEQAAAYRKLVAERAARYGLPPPSPPGSIKLTSRRNELV